MQKKELTSNDHVALISQTQRNLPYVIELEHCLITGPEMQHNVLALEILIIAIPGRQDQRPHVPLELELAKSNSPTGSFTKPV